MKKISELNVGTVLDLNAVECQSIVTGQKVEHKALTVAGKDNPNAGSFYWRMQYLGVNFNIDNERTFDDLNTGNVVKCILEVTEYENRAGETVKGLNFVSHVTMAQYANAQKNQAMMKKMDEGSFFDKVDFLATLDLKELSEASA